MAEPQTPHNMPGYRIDSGVRVEMDVSWRDVDALNRASEIIRDHDMLATSLNATLKNPIPLRSSISVSDAMRSLAERIVGKLPPRGTANG